MSSLAIGGLVAHCIFFWGPYVISSFKHARDKTQPDPHWVAMREYKEAPWWWYITLLVLAFFAGECMRRHYPARTSDVFFRVLRRSYQRAQGRDDVACLVVHRCPHFGCDHRPVLNAPIRTYGHWHRHRPDFQDDCWFHQPRKACCKSLCGCLDSLLPCPLIWIHVSSQFAMWSHDVIGTSIGLASDLKLGQYLKVCLHLRN